MEEEEDKENINVEAQSSDTDNEIDNKAQIYQQRKTEEKKVHVDPPFVKPG